MAQTVRYLQLAALTVALVTLLLGCKSEVSGKNAMPDTGNMSPSDKRKAMVQWHQQHDKQPTGSAPQSGQ